MKQYDNRGRKIDYDAPGQLGRHTPKPEKLKKRARFNEQLDALVEYHNGRGQLQKPLHVTLDQLRLLMGVPKEQVVWEPTGAETYRDHPLFVVDDE